MRDSFPFLNQLTVPVDAGVGDDRVVIGPGTLIEVYDNNILVIRVNENGIQVLPNQPVSGTFSAEMQLARGGVPQDDVAAIFWISDTSGLGTDEATIQVLNFGTYDQALLISPRVREDDSAAFIIGSDRTQPSTFRFRDEGTGTPVDIVQIEGGATADLWFNHPSTLVPRMSLPRGLVDQQVISSTGSTFSVSSATDMVLNNQPVVAGRTYAVHLHTTIEWNSLNIAAEWDLTFRVNGVNDSTFAYLKPNLTGTTILLVDAIVYWTPSVTANTDDLSVFAGEVVDGASITLTGSAINHRTLTLIDMGVL